LCNSCASVALQDLFLSFIACFILLVMLLNVFSSDGGLFHDDGTAMCDSVILVAPPSGSAWNHCRRDRMATARTVASLYHGLKGQLVSGD